MTILGKLRRILDDRIIREVHSMNVANSTYFDKSLCLFWILRVGRRECQKWRDLGAPGAFFWPNSKILTRSLHLKKNMQRKWNSVLFSHSQPHSHIRSHSKKTHFFFMFLLRWRLLVNNFRFGQKKWTRRNEISPFLALPPPNSQKSKKGTAIYRNMSS